MKFYDILIFILLTMAVQYIDFDKNALKAFVTGGVFAFWLKKWL